MSPSRHPADNLLEVDQFHIIHRLRSSSPLEENVHAQRIGHPHDHVQWR